jgi:hypothetical protein
MQENQNRVFFILGTLLVLGLLAISLLDPPKSEEALKWSKPYTVDSSTVTRVQIEADGAEYRIGKAAGRWHFEDEEKSLVDEENMQSWIDMVLNVECGEKVGTEYDLFGLAPPKWKVSLFDESSTLLADLSIGIDAPVGWNTYVLCGQDNVQLSRDKLSAVVDSGIDGLRFMGIVAADPTMVDSVILADGATLTRIDGAWVLESPYRAKTEPQAVDSWLSEIVQIRAIRRTDATQEGGGVDLILKMNDVSHVLGLNGTILASPLHSGAIELNAEDAASIMREHSHFLSRRLVDSSVDLESIEIDFNGKQRTIHKGEDGWEDGGETAAALYLNSYERIPLPKGNARGTIGLRTASDVSQTYTIMENTDKDSLWLQETEEEAAILLPDELKAALIAPAFSEDEYTADPSEEEE